jgi:hypothetical protein
MRTDFDIFKDNLRLVFFARRALPHVAALLKDDATVCYKFQ